MEAAAQTSTLSSSLITIISIVIISIIFLGWSFIGWVIALIWAFKNENINNNNIDSQQ